MNYCRLCNRKSDQNMYTFDERPLCVQCYVAYYRGWHDQKLDSKPVTAVAEDDEPKTMPLKIVKKYKCVPVAEEKTDEQKFNDWIRAHPMTIESLWSLQNCLNSLWPGNEVAKMAKELWLKEKAPKEEQKGCDCLPKSCQDCSSEHIYRDIDGRLPCDCPCHKKGCEACEAEKRPAKETFCPDGQALESRKHLVHTCQPPKEPKEKCSRCNSPKNWEGAWCFKCTYELSDSQTNEKPQEKIIRHKKCEEHKKCPHEGYVDCSGHCIKCSPICNSIQKDYYTKSEIDERMKALLTWLDYSVPTDHIRLKSTFPVPFLSLDEMRSRFLTKE